jgi:hypothetical protein
MLAEGLGVVKGLGAADNVVGDGVANTTTVSVTVGMAMSVNVNIDTTITVLVGAFVSLREDDGRSKEADKNWMLDEDEVPRKACIDEGTGTDDLDSSPSGVRAVSVAFTEELFELEGTASETINCNMFCMSANAPRGTASANTKQQTPSTETNTGRAIIDIEGKANVER